MPHSHLVLFQFPSFNSTFPPRQVLLFTSSKPISSHRGYILECSHAAQVQNKSSKGLFYWIRGWQEWNGEGTQITCSGTQHSASVSHLYIWLLHCSHRTYIFMGAFVSLNKSAELPIIQGSFLSEKFHVNPRKYCKHYSTVIGYGAWWGHEFLCIVNFTPI